ncbi:hypothetical protein QMS86_18895 [Cronobacter dublinensis]|uniref:hypothetical protein n=1 Tax=Cronobacter dublinensis TaxID=413497 RepID=UPI00382C96E4
MVNSTEFNILTLLASRDDVKWTWYSLDRAMSQRKMEGVGNVARLVRNLHAAGLVDITPSTPAGMDYYHISAKGIRLLKEIQKQNI